MAESQIFNRQLQKLSLIFIERLHFIINSLGIVAPQTQRSDLFFQGTMLH